MRFTFTSYTASGTRVDVCVRPESIPEGLFARHGYVEISDNRYEAPPVCRVTSQDELDEFLVNVARAEKREYQEKRPYNALEEVDGYAVKKDVQQAAINKLTLGELTGHEKKKKKIRDHVDPKHYQGYIGELQWLEAMQYLPEFRDPAVFVGALSLTIRGYMDRRGGKDNVAQEDLKALWYMKFKTAFVLNGCKPIRVAQVEQILAGAGEIDLINNPRPM